MSLRNRLFLAGVASLLVAAVTLAAVTWLEHQPVYCQWQGAC